MTKQTFLFTDTETTGFSKNGSLVQDGQARIVQAAFILADEERRVLATHASIIKPDGWSISEGAQRIHGISEVDCEIYGVNIGGTLSLFHKLADIADLVVAHNKKFDRKMYDIEDAYFHQNSKSVIKKNQTDWFCTMENNAHLDGGKSLKNCLKHYTGRDIGDDAHDALVDTKACMDVFFAMRQKQIDENPMIEASDGTIG